MSVGSAVRTIRGNHPVRKADPTNSDLSTHGKTALGPGTAWLVESLEQVGRAALEDGPARLAEADAEGAAVDRRAREGAADGHTDPQGLHQFGDVGAVPQGPPRDRHPRA